MHRQPARRTVLGAAAAAVLGGCTGTGSDGEVPNAPVGPSTTVTAANGPVPLPSAPLRVAVLDTAELDSAMTLGITPVGASRAPADRTVPDYWPARRLAELADTGTVGGPDLDRLRALRPELILSSQTRDAANYDALRAIAPTVLSQTTGYPWKDNVQLHARALGRLPEADALADAYRGQVAQLLRQIGGPGPAGGRRVSVVRFVEGRIRLYGRQNFLGTILADLQLGRPDAQNVDRFDVETTPDQLAGADGDLLLYSSYGNPDAAGATPVLTGPGWQALGAVRAHRAFPVDDLLWFQGIGYTGAGLVLAQLQQLLSF
ncbi:ABC transporter substrate-binding protein [Kitasatospora sp. NPDC052896]|uniref:ABC transporter substrate-binding protein n=1 Tax=Kitasatospora sp. NPDC052896 TaxID=3364061 RepID=UPI0037C9D572